MPVMLTLYHPLRKGRWLAAKHSHRQSLPCVKREHATSAHHIPSPPCAKGGGFCVAKRGGIVCNIRLPFCKSSKMIAKTIPQSLRDSSLCWGGAFLVWILVPFTGGAFWHLCCTAVSFAKESLFYFPIYRKKADAVRSAFASIHFYLCKKRSCRLCFFRCRFIVCCVLCIHIILCFTCIADAASGSKVFVTAAKRIELVSEAVLTAGITIAAVKRNAEILLEKLIQQCCCSDNQQSNPCGYCNNLDQTYTFFFFSHLLFTMPFL